MAQVPEQSIVVPGSSASLASTVGNRIDSPFDALKRMQSTGTAESNATPKQLALHVTAVGKEEIVEYGDDNGSPPPVKGADSGAVVSSEMTTE